MKMLKVMLVVLFSLFTSLVYALDTTAAVATIAGTTVDVETVALAILGVIAAIFAIRKVFAMLGGR